MIDQTQCPSLANLHDLVSGRLETDLAESVAQHLDSCDDCKNAIANIDSRDETFLAAIRESAVHFEFQSEQPCADALQRMRQIAREASKAGPSHADDTVSLAAPSQDTGFGSSAPLVSETYGLRPAEREDEIGRLGNYRVLEVLGAGGMGMVFRAEDSLIHREVAIKTIKPEVAGGNAKERFLREARCAAVIDHDNIVKIYEVGEDQGVPFIVMPMLRGRSLKARLSQKERLDQDEVLRIGLDVAQGLAAAHQRGLIHRDIKPDNLWIEADSERVKILDFGLARAGDDDTGLTQTGAVLGTPKYMSPEQAAGATVDHRSDLFSLGSVLYHVATGHVPFQGKNLPAILIAVTKASPTPVGQIAPDIDDRIVELIDNLLEKDPLDRPQNATDVVSMIAAIQSEVVLTPSFSGDSDSSRNLQTASRASRSRWVVAIGICCLVVIVASSYFALPNPSKHTTAKADHEPLSATNALDSPASTTASRLENPEARVQPKSISMSTDAATMIPRLSDAILAAPADSNAYRQRGTYFARVGDWPACQADFEQTVALNPEDASNWIRLATAMLINDAPGYREMCLKMMDLFRDRAMSFAADHMCKMCMLKPGAIEVSELPANIISIVEDAERDWSQREFRLYYIGNLALIAFRDGDVQRAIELTNEIPQSSNRRSRSLAMAVRALALRQVGRVVEAQQTTDTASAMIPRDLRKLMTEGGRREVPIQSTSIHPNWLISYLLLKESGPVSDKVEDASGFAWSAPKSLGPAINAGAYNFNPWLSSDGLELWYTANKGSRYGSGEIFVARRKSVNQSWGPAESIGPPINSPQPESEFTLSQDRLELIFLRSNRLMRATRESSDAPWSEPTRIQAWQDHTTTPVLSSDGVTLYIGRHISRGGSDDVDVCMMTRADKDALWSTPQPIQGNLNSNQYDSPTCESADGCRLMIESERPGGIGEADFWLASRPTRDSPWETPIHLGAPINTPKREVTGCWANDGQSFYFASFVGKGRGFVSIFTSHQIEQPHDSAKGSR